MSIFASVKNRISSPRSGGRKLIAMTAVTIMICSLYFIAKSDDPVPYPADYRSWAHVKSSLVGPKSPSFQNNGGIFHTYANQKAMEGYRSGQFPDGSVIVADFLETREITEGKMIGLVVEGPRRRIDVMVKDSKRYVETGGWGFETFRGDSQTDRVVAAQAVTKCFTCHSQQKEKDFVFSTYRK